MIAFDFQKFQAAALPKAALVEIEAIAVIGEIEDKKD